MLGSVLDTNKYLIVRLTLIPLVNVTQLRMNGEINTVFQIDGKEEGN